MISIRLSLVSLLAFNVAILFVPGHTDHDERHICFAEAIWDGGTEGTNSADGTGLFFEGRSTQVILVQ